MAASSPARAASSYSIDVFAEFSCFAVSRTLSTSAIATPPAIGATSEPRTTQEQDEELFRDLFAADNDWEYPAPPSQQQQHLCQKQATIGHHHKALKAVPIWSTGSGSGGSSPFLSAAFGSSSFAQSPTPTLSAPVPRLNLAELMNARPGDGSSSNVWGGGLCQLPEEDDDNDDSEGSEDRPESNMKPKAKSTSKRKLKTSKPNSNSDNNNSNSVNSKLHHETLSFLEKLDLKALLHTPRPDVLDFYPTSSTGGPTGSSNGSGVSAVNQFASKMDDSRVENLERDPVASICNAFNNSSYTVKGKSIPGKALGKKHPTAPSAEVSSRLSHMESTYGTTKSEPRKARKGTTERLANPIIGYTSTLQALSPGQRRKRELMNMDDDEEERGERGWKDNNHAANAKPRRKEPKDGPSSPLSHLTTSTQVYEAAPSSSSQRLQKKPAAQSRESSNNQLDDERDNINTQSLPVKRKPTPGEKKKAQPLSARKAALKKKIEEKQLERSNQSASEYSTPASGSTTAAIAGATFLTQHEEEKEKLNSRVAVKRGAPQFRRPSLSPPISTVPNCSSELFASRQPRRPVSVHDLKKQEPLSIRATQNSRRMNNNKASDEREAKGSTRKPQSKSASVGKPTYREVQNRPKRPSGNRQQPTAPVTTPAAVMSAAAPRKPSNGEMGKPSGRRPFPRANADGNSASGTQTTKADPSTTSVPKRKQLVGKASTSEMLLMGAAGHQPSNNNAAATLRRGDSNGRQARKAQVYTLKKAPNNSTGSATPKGKPAGRRPSRETGAVASSAERVTKSSVELPSIHPPQGKQPAESGVRRNFVYRRMKAN